MEEANGRRFDVLRARRDRNNRNWYAMNASSQRDTKNSLLARSNPGPHAYNARGYTVLLAAKPSNVVNSNKLILTIISSIPLELFAASAMTKAFLLEM